MIDISAIGNLVVEVVCKRNDSDALNQRNDPRVLKIRCVLRQRLLPSDDCLEVVAHACANAS
jgi:hypothetical protein